MSKLNEGVASIESLEAIIAWMRTKGVESYKNSLCLPRLVRVTLNNLVCVCREILSAKVHQHCCLDPMT